MSAHSALCVGTVGAEIERIGALFGEINPFFGEDAALAPHAAVGIDLAEAGDVDAAGIEAGCAHGV